MASIVKQPEPEVPKKFPDEQMEDQLPPLRNLKQNNNRHVVTFGIITCLFTLYITATAIRQSNYSIDSDTKRDEEIMLLLQEKENRRQAMILEKLLEHEHICSELEIFIKEFKWNDKLMDNTWIPPKETESKNISNQVEIERNNTNRSDTPRVEKNDNNESFDSKVPNKNEGATKKEATKKRTTSAEPIIYLCALVFIYLLVKAASDINNHYKSQAKGDKRLRRCSLQSYAQTHKQDRRASKDRPLTAISNRYGFLEQRSQSFDRSTKSRAENFYQGSEISKVLRKNISIDETTQAAHRFGTHFQYPISMTGKALSRDGANLTDRETLTGSDLLITDMNMIQSRRCSVPVSLGSQISNTSRRTSMAWGSNAGMNSIENADIHFTENKRRVRMINRH